MKNNYQIIYPLIFVIATVFLALDSLNVVSFPDWLVLIMAILGVSTAVYYLIKNK